MDILIDKVALRGRMYKKRPLDILINKELKGQGTTHILLLPMMFHMLKDSGSYEVLVFGARNSPTAELLICLNCGH